MDKKGVVMDKARIGSIFTDCKSLQIPFFQRSYVWDEKNWERFLDDMKNVSQTKKDYFLGTFIMKNNPDTKCSDVISEVRTVIDGQQRFTTLILFFYVLYLKSNDYTEFRRKFFNSADEPTLNHNYCDKPIFDIIISNQLDSEKEKDYSNSQILKAYKYFNDNVNPEDFDARVLFAHLYFVEISVGQNEDEQQIFDTINSLGVRLSTAELLKNYLFSSDDIKLYKENWEKCFEQGEKKSFWLDSTPNKNKRSNIDLFLYAFLSIKSDKEITVEHLFEQFKDYLKEIDYKNNEHNKISLINELKNYAEIYYKNINVNCGNEILIDNANSINRLNIIMFELETRTLLPYCLYILKNANINEQNKIFGFLEKYIMRRMISKIGSTKNYNRLFMSFIKNNILTEEELKAEIYSEQKNSSENSKMPNDDEVENGINNYDHTNQIAKGILYLLETAKRDNKDCTTTLCLSNYQLEHILPKKWEKYWQIIDATKEQEQNRIKHIKLLGNKTLLSSPLNNSIKNASWDIKLNGDPNNNKIGGYKDYAKGLKTFNFDNYEYWNEDTIDQRSKELLNDINDVWNYDNQIISSTQEQISLL